MKDYRRELKKLAETSHKLASQPRQPAPVFSSRLPLHLLQSCIIHDYRMRIPSASHYTHGSPVSGSSKRCSAMRKCLAICHLTWPMQVLERIRKTNCSQNLPLFTASPARTRTQGYMNVFKSKFHFPLHHHAFLSGLA